MEPGGLVRTARDDARSIRRSRLPIAAPLAATIDAGLATHRSDTAAAADSLDRAIEGFTRADRALHRAAARVVRGRLQSGDHGRAEERAGLVWIEAEGIKNPEAMLRILVPCATVR